MTTALTLEEALALPAGPELDAIVAVRAFGWVGVSRQADWKYRGALPNMFSMVPLEVPRFSTDLVEAMEAVTSKVQGYLAWDAPGQWVCVSGTFEGRGETGPLAICRLLLAIYA